MNRPLSRETGALHRWAEGAGPVPVEGPGGAGLIAATAVAAAIAAAYWAIGAQPNGATLSLSLLFGALFGFVLQRSRFCLFCIWRDFLDERDPRGVLGVVAALAVGIVGYSAVLGAWLPNPAGTRLPPQAHIGPVGPVLALAGLAFGAGMAISGSCISSHLYRLGEGSPTALFALIGTLGGFAAGFAAWNPLYLWSVSTSPVLWLPRDLGYAGSVALALAVLAGVALLLLRFLPERQKYPQLQPGPWRAVFVERWPAWIGGLAVGALGTVAYLRIAPLGVTSEIGSRVREAAEALGLLPSRLEGLDTLRGCATAIRDALLTPNGVFVGALVAAASAAALAAGQFRPAWPTASQAIRGLVGGLLLGFGAMIGLGCSIGTFLSGVMAGAVSGWVFGAAMLIGLTATLLAGRRVGALP